MILNRFHIFKEVGERMNIKEIYERYKKGLLKLLEIKNTMSEMKNTLDHINSRLTANYTL